MIINCISDLHGETPALPGGDLLIVAGDMTATDSVPGWKKFYDWLKVQPYRKKIYIGGNHDTFLTYAASQEDPKYQWLNHIEECKRQEGDPIYLCDSGIKWEGYKIWGSPWSKSFKGMNPSCMAFTMPTEEELDEKFGLIPLDTDILITHSPPLGRRDKANHPYRLGSVSLMERVIKVQPKLHVFGHIHGGYGMERPEFLGIPGYPIFVNAAHMDEFYRPVNKPVRVVL